MRGKRKGQKKKKAELCRDRGGDTRIDEQTGGPGRVGGKFLNIYKEKFLSRRSGLV